LPTVVQTLSNNLSSCYPVSIIKTCCQACQEDLCIFLHKLWILCGGREDTMSITIGNPLFQVYPYDLNNSSYAIFGVHGSEVAG
jgi:hypothetical protein